MQLEGMVGGRGAPYLCTIGRICNRCTGFVAKITIVRKRNVSECLYSLYMYVCFDALDANDAILSFHSVYILNTLKLGNCYVGSC